MNPEMVMDKLTQSGYRRLHQPLRIADLDFCFEGALIGPEEENNLVLLMVGEGSVLVAAQRLLRAMAIVLDRAGTAYPLTVIVITDKIDTSTFHALESLARVVVVSPKANLEESLYSLLPLTLPEPIAESLSAKESLKLELGGQSDTVTTRLQKAAQDSADKVQNTMRLIVTDAAENKL